MGKISSFYYVMIFDYSMLRRRLQADFFGHGYYFPDFGCTRRGFLL